MDGRVSSEGIGDRGAAERGGGEGRKSWVEVLFVQVYRGIVYFVFVQRAVMVRRQEGSL